MQTSQPPLPLTLTWSGFREGARLTLPTLPALFALAMAFGGAAAQRGMTLGESVWMSFIVSAGAAQMLSLELWREAWTFGAFVTIALVTATVNARFILMGAQLQPWLSRTSVPRQAVSLFWLFDTSWLITARHTASGGRDLGVLLGAGIFSWSCWVVATAPGHWAGSLITDPRRYALDLVMPCFFAAMAIPLWRGLAVSALPWAVAALVALAVQAIVPGYAFIVAGALSGAITGALARARR